MELNEYQDISGRTAFFPTDRALEYCTIALCGEAGEFANVVKKIIRDGDIHEPTSERQLQLEFELGDTFWYVAQAAKAIGRDLEYIARQNITKLELRHKQRVAGQTIT